MNILEKLVASVTSAIQGPIKGADLTASLNSLNTSRGQALNWQVSIVDLLKLLNMDTSLEARKKLAEELGYTGPDNDGSAAKNIWLHDAVMKQLAERGIKVPT